MDSSFLGPMYKHIFFDLDHTLWDYESNSKEALFEIFIELQLNNILGCAFEDFLKTYHRINQQYWDEYIVLMGGYITIRLLPTDSMKCSLLN